MTRISFLRATFSVLCSVLRQRYDDFPLPTNWQQKGRFSCFYTLLARQRMSKNHSFSVGEPITFWPGKPKNLIKAHLYTRWSFLTHLKRAMALPETNGSHLKMDGWNTSFLLGRLGLFSVAFAVSYREVDM